MSSSFSAPAAELVRRLLREHLPASWRERELPDETALGAGGIGLDSIAILELLLACERDTGRPFPAALLGDGQLTVGRLVAFAALADR